jgi:hypothetical protein
VDGIATARVTVAESQCMLCRAARECFRVQRKESHGTREKSTRETRKPSSIPRFSDMSQDGTPEQRVSFVPQNKQTS